MVNSNAARNNIVIVCILVFIAVFIFFLVDHSNAKKFSNAKKLNNTVSIVKTKTLDKQLISILSSDGNRHDYMVDIAKTQAQQQTGMMFRYNIDKDTGMLFLFDEEAERSFWMKNTFIQLDIIFIRKGGIINHIYSMAEAESLTPISSRGKVIAVLEIAGGEANMLGIHTGDRVLYNDVLD